MPHASLCKPHSNQEFLQVPQKVGNHKTNSTKGMKGI